MWQNVLVKMIFTSGKPAKRLVFLLLQCFSCVVLAQPTELQTQPQTEPPTLEQLLQQQVQNLPASIEVSTASRMQQSAGQAAQVTYLVTAEQIARLNLRTLGEVLSLLPGLYVSSDSSYGYLTSRGIGRPGDYNSRLLFLVDGTRVNDNIYDAGLIGSNFFLDTRLIERVEYSPGSASTLYGNNAFLGVVNIISKKVYQLQGAQLFAGISNQHQHDLLFSYGLRHESGHEGHLAVSQTQRHHIPFPFPEAPAVLQQLRDSNQDNNNRLSGSYNYRQFSLNFARVQRDRLEPGFLAGTWLTEQYIQNDVAFVSVRFSKQLSPTLEWFSHLSSNWMNLKTVTPISEPEFTAPEQLVFNAQGRWTSLDQRLSYQASAQQQWLFGFDLQRDHRQGYRLSIDDELTLASVASDNLRRGLFVQHEWQITPAHRLISGLRYDHSAEQVREFSPKLSWLWQASQADQWRVSYGRAFRAPNEYELENNRFLQLPLPQAEQIENLELSWQRQWASDWHSTLSLYQNHITNLISAVPEAPDLLLFFNEQPVHAKGLELSVLYQWQNSSELSLSLSLQQARYRDQQLLTNAAEQLVKLSYSRALWRDKLRLDYRLFAASKRPALLRPQPGFGRHDLLLNWQVVPELQLQLGLKNLTDRRYTDAPLPGELELAQAGRQLEFSLCWNFF